VPDLLNLAAPPEEPPMEVRRLGVSDAEVAADAIRLLKTSEGGPTPSAACLAGFLSRPENVLILASADGEPVGFAVAYLLDRIDRDQQMMFFYEIGVAESHRRRGIGKRMIIELKAICREGNVMKMWVPTGRSNIAATRLYASTGAVPLPGGDEVTYAYPCESFASGAG
jgi:aminoglycoside 3-N-acetyltransferase I